MEGGKEDERLDSSVEMEGGSSRRRSMDSRRSARSVISVNLGKRRRYDSDVNVQDVGDDECMSIGECAEDDVERLKSVGVRLRKYLFSEANRISKSASEYILGCMCEYEEQMIRLMGKNERLRGRFEECNKHVYREQSIGVSAKSFAVTASTSVDKSVIGGERVSAKTGGSESLPKKSYVVIVKSSDANDKMTSDQVREKVLRDVSGGLNVRVRALRKTRSGGVVIETASESESKKIKECVKFKEVGLSVESPRKIGPKMIIYDVSNILTNEALLNDMYERNVKQCVSVKKFKDRQTNIYLFWRLGPLKNK